MPKAILTALLSTMIALLACDGERITELETQNEKVSYALGLRSGISMKTAGLKVDLQAFRRGIEDTLRSRKRLLSDSTVFDIFGRFQANRGKMDLDKQDENRAAMGELRTFNDSLNYAVGLNAGASLSMFRDQIDIDIFVQAIDDTLNNKGVILSSSETNEAFKTFQQEIVNKVGQTNARQGEDFLAKNREEEGVKVTESGLQYKVIESGNGPKPEETDRVKVHYRGTLLDGTEFDSSYERNQPAVFGLKQVIPGWTEGLQLMPVGSKFKFYIPSNLAYGERGAGAQIGPHSTLLFEVELLGIESN